MSEQFAGVRHRAQAQRAVRADRRAATARRDRWRENAWQAGFGVPMRGVCWVASVVAERYFTPPE